jgi:hypothetical protein
VESLFSTAYFYKRSFFFESTEIKKKMLLNEFVNELLNCGEK